MNSRDTEVNLKQNRKKDVKMINVVLKYCGCEAEKLVHFYFFEIGIRDTLIYLFLGALIYRGCCKVSESKSLILYFF